jgi:putative FmdB family regulatory protein
MPTYEYQCEECDYQFEEFQSITAKPLRKCPKCKKMKLNRLIGTGAGIIFKGSGFYETDYRSKDYAEKAKKEKESGSGSDKKTDSKTESKSTTDTQKSSSGEKTTGKKKD